METVVVQEATKRWPIGVCNDCGQTLWLDDTGNMYCEGCEPGKRFWNVVPGSSLLEVGGES